MARSDAPRLPAAPLARARRRVRRAYELAHLGAAARGLAIAAGALVLALGFHRAASATWLVAGALALALAVLGWRGGALRRGAFAGVIAGLPPLVVPSLVLALSSGAHAHCADCAPRAMLPCMLACLGSGALVGILVGYRASADAAPRRYAVAAIAAATLTGLLGCGTTGLGGALGIAIGVVAGGVTGWVFAGRTAHV
jgi:hypothetical protein